jgi:hypothetical protein
VLIGPRVVEGSICRVVKTADGSAFTETWVDGSWARNGSTIGSVMAGAPASAEVLEAAGVPVSDRTAGELDHEPPQANRGSRKPPTP